MPKGFEGNMARWRHFTVAVGLVPALIIYVGMVMALADYIINIHWLVDLVFYLFAGLIWIPAAKPPTPI
jgi:hypothetical protein